MKSLIHRERASSPQNQLLRFINLYISDDCSYLIKMFSYLSCLYLSIFVNCVSLYIDTVCSSLRKIVPIYFYVMRSEYICVYFSKSFLKETMFSSIEFNKLAHS